MKKFVSVILALTMMLSLAACGGNGEAETTTAPAEIIDVEPETTVAAPVAASALEIMENVWNLYGEDEKFAVIGGNMESPVDGAPGNYDMAYAENLSYNLIIPADSLASIDGAATMIHMMNANTFTSGVVHLTEGTDAAAFAQTMKDAINGNQWMCGFPEQMLIAVIDSEYVVICFGAADLLGVFWNHMMEAYAGAEILFSEAVEG